jgi:endonuclease-8
MRDGMPEGHTIRALGDQWLAHQNERFVLESPSHSVPGLQDLDGQELTEVATHGKHLFLRFGQGWLHVHLGRFGRFYWHERTRTMPEPRAIVRVRFISESIWVDLVGPIAVAVVNEHQKDEIESRLGADPLVKGADTQAARRQLQASKRAIGALLMDQSIIAGIGNIYRAELLWRSRVDPYTPGTSISDELFEQLWHDARLLLEAGVRDYQANEPTHTVGLPLPDGSSPLPAVFGKRNHTQVYQRAGLECARCGALVQQAEMSGRTLFWCPGCQVL